MGGSRGFLKCGSIIFNVLVFFIGAALLGFGIYILVSDYGPKVLSKLLGDEFYHVAAYSAIASGGAIVVISWCGCIGTAKENRPILFVYSLLMGIIFAVLLTTAVLVFLFLGQTSVKTRDTMKSVLIERYGVNNDHAENRMVTDVWNFVQKELKCCGISGDANSTESWAIYKNQTKWFKQLKDDKPLVPESCCDPNGDIDVCVGLKAFNGPPTQGPPLMGSNRKNPNLYHTGCYDELVHYIQSHSLMIGGISVAANVIILFGVIFGVCLFRSIRQHGFIT